MGSFNSSVLRRNAKLAARSAAEAAVAGAAVMAAAIAVWRAAGEREGLLIGGVSAWLASSVSLAGLLVAKASKNAKVFWWAFGGGMGLRLATLAALMAYGTSQDRALSQPALLLAYAFGVLFFLLMESRHIKLK